LPCDLTYLMDLKRVADLQLVPLFSCYEDGVMTPTIFTGQIETGSLKGIFLEDETRG
jgi:hypothetical protein